jgi:hypothetical protein
MIKYIHTIEFKEEDYEETTTTTPCRDKTNRKSWVAKYDEMTINGMQIRI